MDHVTCSVRRPRPEATLDGCFFCQRRKKGAQGATNNEVVAWHKPGGPILKEFSSERFRQRSRDCRSAKIFSSLRKIRGRHTAGDYAAVIDIPDLKRYCGFRCW